MPRKPTKSVSEKTGICMLCGFNYHEHEFGIDLGFRQKGLPLVCLKCCNMLLRAMGATNRPVVIEEMVAIATEYISRADNISPQLQSSMEQSLFSTIDPLTGMVRHDKPMRLAEPSKGITRERLGTPREIYDFLSLYCYGQEQAKKTLAVAVHNHYKRILHEQENAKKSRPKDNVELVKSNVLMIGPTGSGKTLLAQALARKLQVPFAIADATTLTEAGYVGEDVENILLRLIQAADNDISKAEIGIVYVDEIDKIARKTNNVSITRDVSGEGVQQALLKILENTIANIPPKGGRKHPDQEYVQLNTKNILFICGGAFVGLDKIVAKRGGARPLGFGADEKPASGLAIPEEELARNPLDYVEPEDLITFGLIPEFVGRLPVVTALKELSKDDLLHILTEPKDAIVKQFKELMSISGVDLEFTQDALEAVAEIACVRKTGARGLRAIIEKRMLDVMFDIPKIAKTQKAKCVIDGQVIRGEKKAVITIEEK